MRLKRTRYHCFDAAEQYALCQTMMHPLDEPRLKEEDFIQLHGNIGFIRLFDDSTIERKGLRLILDIIHTCSRCCEILFYGTTGCF